MNIHQMPYSLEAEQAVLGAILVDSTKMADVAEVLKSEDFYLESHQGIYSAMQEMFISNRIIDYVTLLDKLEKDGVFSKLDGAQYIKKLADIMPSLENLKEYIQIVKDKAILRELAQNSYRIAEEALAEEGDASEIVNNAAQKIFAITQEKYKGDFSNIKDVIVENYNLMEKAAAGETGTKTGFSGIDKYLIGMGKGDFIVIGARPGIGKTALALNIAEKVSKEQTVVIFSLEMSKTQLVSRLLSCMALIDNNKLRTGKLSENEWLTFNKAASTLAKRKILIDDTAGMTISAMKAKLRRVKNLGLVIVDYLQLMQSDKKSESRVQEVSAISRNLKLLAKDFDVPVLACAQLSRASETREKKKPVLSDLRDSGAIEQDADVIMFLYRDYYGEKEEAQNVAEVIIAKNRHGSTGNVTLGWYGQYYKFVDVKKGEKSENV